MTDQQRPAGAHRAASAIVGIGRSRSVPDALQAAVDTASELLDANAVYAWWDDGAERTAVASGMPATDGLAQTWALLTEPEPLCAVRDASSEPVLAALGWTKVAVLRAPLGGPGAGALLAIRRSGEAFADAEQELGDAVAAQTGMALEMVHVEERYRRLEAELATAEQLKTEFVAMTSHELRTPLTSIRAATSMIRSYWDTITDERKMRLLEVIEGQAQRLSRLVENILAAANIEAGVVLPRITTVDLAAAADDVARDFAAELDVVVAVERPLIAEADPDHTRQILINFVGNSLKYGEPPVTISGRRQDRSIELRVTDCGPGVPPDFVPRLFDRFTQASSGYSRHASGSGLGLSIVKGLAEAVGGSVHYEEHQPTGSSFVLHLPAS
ncbi:MAG: hypothetical protein GEU74_09435 [Nitriliruptorales bacterium]|nr:hypothetical protein [Nitriliruptorales bacterium]